MHERKVYKEDSQKKDPKGKQVFFKGIDDSRMIDRYMPRLLKYFI